MTELPPAWSFDEVAHAGDEHLEGAYVAAYDRKAAFDPTDELALMAELGLDENSTMVDLGVRTERSPSRAQFCPTRRR